MVKINKLITPYNYTAQTNKRNMWIIIHYVGAVSTASANAKYFYTAKRNASAHYFVDENEIWQCVEDNNSAWHIGGAYKYYNSARNNNSIGIEMCCKKKNNNWYIEPATINNTIELTKQLMQKYNVPIERVARHYDCTGKICPEPFVKNEDAWQNFLKEVAKGETAMADIPEISIIDKQTKIKEIMNVDDNTVQYFSFYKHNVPLFDKLYAVCVDAEKWRKMAKN